MVHEDSDMQVWGERWGQWGSSAPRRGGAVLAFLEGGRWSVWRCTRGTGFLQEAAGDSQGCTLLQHFKLVCAKTQEWGLEAIIAGG